MNIMTYKKTEHFEPIAMKCTEEQFESIKPILEQFGLYPENIEKDWNDWCYLKNNGASIRNFITNIRESWKSDNNRIVYETFNAETFLKACGIVSEPLYQLTAKEIKHAFENPQYLKDTFKECFETELEVGIWYKANSNGLAYKDENGNYYGFDGVGEFVNSRSLDKYYEFENPDWDWQPATEKEVEEALVKEAIKRGYKKGTKVTSVMSKNERVCEDDMYYNSFESNQLLFGHECCIFMDGVWSEIIPVPTYTIKEAESKFNIKIKAV